MRWRKRVRSVVAVTFLVTGWSTAVPAASSDRPDEVAPATTNDVGDAESGHGAEGAPRLSDEPIPLQLDGFPERPRPIVDWGNDFLGSGTLWPGFLLPTGAVWQPALVAFGQWRNAAQSVDDGFDQRTELRTRLDLFFNLSFSGSERLVVGFRPLDHDGSFTRYVIDGDDEGFQDELNGEIAMLFFEGDFGEIFPELSVDDFRRTDIGFSVGRQPLVFQEGYLVQDVPDALGVTRNTLMPSQTSNLRLTFLGAWNEIHRLGVEDDDAALLGLFTSTDTRPSTIDADVVYLSSDGELGDQVGVGVSFVQRLGSMSSSFRLLSSYGLDDPMIDGVEASLDGSLAVAELGWTPHRSLDYVYVNPFIAVDDYVPVARAPGIGGPLAGIGIGFAGSGLGFDGPLSSESSDVAGVAIGYQKFMNDTRSQLIFELGGRVGLDAGIEDQAAATVRWQQALRKHYVFLVDGFFGWRDRDSADDTLIGGRVELVTKF